MTHNLNGLMLGELVVRLKNVCVRRPEYEFIVEANGSELDLLVADGSVSVLKSTFEDEGLEQSALSAFKLDLKHYVFRAEKIRQELLAGDKC